MLKCTLAILIAMAMSASASVASAEDLIQIYRDALTSDPVLASARATLEATQERRAAGPRRIAAGGQPGGECGRRGFPRAPAHRSNSDVSR